MRRYTTPTHTFTVPFDTVIIKSMNIIYSQNDIPVVTKEIKDCECNGNTIKVQLTQEETAMLDCKKHFAEVQIHALTVTGEVIASDPYKIPVKKCFAKEVLE